LFKKSATSSLVIDSLGRLLWIMLDIRYLKVAIALALGSDDIRDMPKTKTALNELYQCFSFTIMDMFTISCRSLLQILLLVFPSLGHQDSLPGGVPREHPF
jgi:hypothetical protein